MFTTSDKIGLAVAALLLIGSIGALIWNKKQLDKYFEIKEENQKTLQAMTALQGKEAE